MNRIRFLQSFGRRNPSLKDCLLKHPRSVQARPSQAFVQISYEAFKDKLVRLGSVNERVQGQWNSFKSKRKQETKSTEHTVSLSQQVTPVIIEMIERQSSLKSMLYVTDKLLPKMTLADRIKVQEIATDRLYSEIADESVVFNKGKYHSSIYHRLHKEGTLSDKVKPLSQAGTFNRLIVEIADSVDHMERWQILNVFLNLQLLDWPKESHPVITLFEKVQSLKFSDLTLQEFLLYTDALLIYKPTTYLRQTQALMFDWFDKHEVTFTDELLEAINRLITVNFESQMFKSGHTFQNFKKEVLSGIFENMQHQVIVQSLTCQDCCILLKILYSISKPLSTTITEKYEQVILEQMRKTLDDVTVNDLPFISKLPKDYLSELMKSKDFQCVTLKCLHVLSQEQQLKSDELVNILILLSKIRDDEDKWLHMLEIQKHELTCVKKMDISALLYYSLNMPFHDVYVFTEIQNRVKKYVMEGLFDRIEVHPYLQLSCYYFAFGANRFRVRKDVALEVRDKLIENILKTDRFNPFLQQISLQMCLRKLKMTPTSIELLESVNMHFIENINFRSLRYLTEKAYEGYRFDFSETMFYRYNNAMCMLLTKLLEKTAFYQSVWLSDWRDVTYSLDPVLQIIFTEKIGWIYRQEKISSNILLSVYQPSLSNPRQVMEKLLNNSDINRNTPYIILCRLVTDNFFHECGKVNEVQQSEALAVLKDKSKGIYMKDILDPDFKRTPRIHQIVTAPKEVHKWIWRAFKEQVGRTISKENNLSLDLVMLTNKDHKIVKFTKEKLENAERLGLQKVAIFYRGPKTQEAFIDLKKTIFIPLLQKSGIKCVVIWHQEWFSIANRTYSEKVRLIQSKVESQSMKNTAPTFSYDLAKVKQGPYKDYFMNMDWSLDRMDQITDRTKTYRKKSGVI